MSKVGTMHVLDSQASPSSSSLAIQNTWSVLAGSANNGTVGKGSSTLIDSSGQAQLYRLRFVHAPFSVHRLTIRGKYRKSWNTFRRVSDNSVRTCF